MKNLFTFIVLFAFVCSPLLSKAQVFDEVDLQGEWNVTSYTGNATGYIVSFDKIVIKDVILDEYNFGAGYVENIIFDNKTGCSNHDRELISDYFISNGNKLHILLDPSWSETSLRFIITELTDETMKLTSYDKKCTITLSKDTSGIDEVTSTITRSGQRHNLMGQTVSKDYKGIVFEDGKKLIVK